MLDVMQQIHQQAGQTIDNQQILYAIPQSKKCEI